jgi:hypothetical protein
MGPPQTRILSATVPAGKVRKLWPAAKRIRTSEGWVMAGTTKPHGLPASALGTNRVDRLQRYPKFVRPRPRAMVRWDTQLVALGDEARQSARVCKRRVPSSLTEAGTRRRGQAAFAARDAPFIASM